MSACAYADENGVLYVTVQGVSDCTGYVVMSAAEYSQFAVMPTTEDLTVVASWGFGAVVFCYFAGYAIGIVKRLVSIA